MENRRRDPDPPATLHAKGTNPLPDLVDLDWRVESRTGSAQSLHDDEPERVEHHLIRLLRPRARSLVLGSTQSSDLVAHDEARRRGIDVARRRSGGGLVHLDPATDCWVDVYLPTESPLWEADIGRSFQWLGATWARVLAEALPPDLTIDLHRPSSPRSRPLWCFDGLGHGEITVEGWKVLGLSQRRRRDRIRHQAQIAGSWPGRDLAGILAHDAVARSVADGRIDPGAWDPARVLAGPPPGTRLPGPRTLEDRFLALLGQARPAEETTITEPG